MCGVSRLEHVRNDEIRRRVHRNRHYAHNQHEKTHMVWTRPKNVRRTVAQKDVGLGTKQEKKKGKTQTRMEREHTPTNGTEEPTTQGMGE